MPVPFTAYQDPRLAELLQKMADGGFWMGQPITEQRVRTACGLAEHPGGIRAMRILSALEGIVAGALAPEQIATNEVREAAEEVAEDSDVQHVLRRLEEIDMLPGHARCLFVI